MKFIPLKEKDFFRIKYNECCTRDRLTDSVALTMLDLKRIMMLIDKCFEKGKSKEDVRQIIYSVLPNEYIDLLKRNFSPCMFDIVGLGEVDKCLQGIKYQK